MLAYFGESISAPEQLDPPLLEHRNVDDDRRSPTIFLELGSGTGIVASYLANHVSLGDRDTVIATDLPEVCSLLESNLRASCRRDRSLHIRPLSWGDHQHALNIHTELIERWDRPQPWKLKIICSDLVSGQFLTR